MKFDKVQFVYIDIDYLRLMHNTPKMMNENYKNKPHLGILLNHENREYVIPLTSAKPKHENWADVSGGWYRIYEIIDITTTQIKYIPNKLQKIKYLNTIVIIRN